MYYFTLCMFAVETNDLHGILYFYEFTEKSFALQFLSFDIFMLIPIIPLQQVVKTEARCENISSKRKKKLWKMLSMKQQLAGGA